MRAWLLPLRAAGALGAPRAPLASLRAFSGTSTPGSGGKSDLSLPQGFFDEIGETARPLEKVRCVGSAY